MNDSESQVEALQRQVFVLLLAAIVVSATLAAYLYYQQHIFRKDAANLRQQAGAVINAYQIERVGAANFVKEISAFGATHPDFAQQVLNKYGFRAGQPTNASARTAPVKK